jgi:hypothetical protein
MKLNTLLAVPALLAALLLSACGEEATEATDAAAGAATEAVDDAAAATVDAAAGAAAAVVDAVPATGGGYEPTAEERVPGETRAVDAAPAEAAPAEAAPAN